MNTNFINSNPITNILNNSLIDLPTPASISTLWNIGFLLGITLTLQIVSGLFLSISYNSSAIMAFSNMVDIIQDINNGWATRIFHINGASLFFILLYLHTARGIYFNSPINNNNVWSSGVLLLLSAIATAFLGYVLPWGQISFWGATVITGVLSAIPILGNDLVTWIWGGPSVSNPTLNRFFSLHFILPIVIVVLAGAHLLLLHENGSSNPSNIISNPDNIKFNPFFSANDSIPIISTITLVISLISITPNLLGDVENFNPANPLNAPLHIQPEWYFLFAYVILRSIPSNLGGVIALAMSILILAILTGITNTPTNFNPTNNICFWLLISVIGILTWIGANPVELPFETIGQIYTIIYFSMILAV